MYLFVMRLFLLLFTGTFTGFSIYCIYTQAGSFWVHMVSGIVQTILFVLTAREMHKEHKKINGVPFSNRLSLAKMIIAQVKDGEWKPTKNPFFSECYELERNGCTMWVANGAWGLKFDKTELLGQILNSYVWHVAVKHVVKAENKRLSVTRGKTREDIINELNSSSKPTLKVVK